ncbi:hypothetical protein ACIQM3_16605 [Streptomyces sp. NPDC091271]|uniref:hypothetical protein n=1 Tax=Streptomyces sp. NPDC091271 TaxID=3365980 RepID=UPI0037F6798D
MRMRPQGCDKRLGVGTQVLTPGGGAELRGDRFRDDLLDHPVQQGVLVRHMVPTAEGRGVAGLLRPYARGFAVVVGLQVTGAPAGLVPLLAVVELGGTLLAPGPVDHSMSRSS